MHIRILEAVTHQSQSYGTGDVVDLPEHDARLLIALGHAEPAPDDRRKTPSKPTDKE